MRVEYSEIRDAFDFVSGGAVAEHEAWLDTETGRISWHSEYGDAIHH